MTPIQQQKSRAIARKPRDAAAVCFALKFVDIHHKCKCTQARNRVQECVVGGNVGQYTSGPSSRLELTSRELLIRWETVVGHSEDTSMIL